MARQTKQEWEEHQRRQDEAARKHALLRGVLAEVEDAIWMMEGGVHTVGTRANPDDEEDWGIVIGVAKRTDAFNNELGSLRGYVAKLLKRKDAKRTVFVVEGPPPQRPGSGQS